MKIRRLEIQGFKSFADRTTIEFGDGITAIVGPNGCGKSNVVDAVKWVLGDMSPKSLRGKRMEDVIFAGSAGRKPAGMAEVTVVLNNEDGSLPTERTEVAITRRLYRSGEGEVLLNGDAGRLKDVRELFLDTGLGGDGSSIMEQGQIDALLRANAVDRRGVFEEAAGVSRYKQRKKEAESKLQKTAENLERLRDVLELEEKRLRSLKTQASRARRYRELCDELRRAKVLSAVARYRGVAQERQAVEAAVAAVREREEAAARALAEVEAQGARLDAEREAAREAAHRLEQRIAEAASEVRAAEDRAAFARRSAEDLAARLEAGSAASAAAAERARALEGDAVLADGEGEGAGRDVDAATARLFTEEGDIQRLAERSHDLRSRLEAAKAEALEALGRISDARNQETALRTEARQAEARAARLGDQRAEARARLVAVEDEERVLTEAALRMEGESERLRAALAEAEEALVRHGREAEDAERRRTEVSEERAKRTERLDVLRRLAAAFEGVEEGARRVLEEAAGRPDHGGVLGLLADAIEATPEGAHVLDALLGHAAGAVVVSTTAEALAWLDWIRAQGAPRARFLALDMVRADAPPPPEAAGPLGGEPGVLRLVGSIAAGSVLVPDLASGIAAWLAAPAGTNAVTPSGDRVTASGALVGGAGTSALGLVERAAEVRRLTEEVAALSARADAAGRAAVAARSARAAAEADVRALRQEIARRVEDRGRHGADLARCEKDRAHLVDAEAQAAAEIAEQEEARARAEGAAATAAALVASLEAERAGSVAVADALAADAAAVDEEVRLASERRTETRLAIASARGRAEASTARAARLRAEAAATLAGLDAAAREAADLAARRSAAEVEIAEAEASSRAAEAARRESADALVAARRSLDAAERSLAEGRGKTAEISALHGRLREELEEQRRRESEHRVRIETLVEQVRTEHGVDLLAEAGTAEAAADPAAVEAAVSELRARIEDLGNVNMNAIVELEEAEGRVGFLQGNEKDLLDAKTQLEAAIVQLDELSVTRFQETFDAVREHFREIFRRLFGGGRAEIILEDPNDLLGSGIEIVARPPGKEQRTISLLSGGEKTLTAVALLFAVFRAKPSPFAILDEVDAALDEANIRRLVSLVGEFTSGTQFLVVTHAKTTMESANLLYGVTMEEPGVSKKVGVRLGDASPAPVEPEIVAATA